MCQATVSLPFGLSNHPAAAGSSPSSSLTSQIFVPLSLSLSRYRTLKETLILKYLSLSSYSMDTKDSPANPNPNISNPMLAFHFLPALARINSSVPKPSPARRSRRIRRAAYASMAVAGGPRGAWRRALLRRLRSSGSRGRRARVAVFPRRMRVARISQEEPTRAGTLRRLVPGGRSMDYCSLLEETADYIQCLSAQVQLMQTVVDSISQ